MDKDTFINSIKEIGISEDSTDRLTKLTDLQENISKIFDDKAELENQVQTLKETITKKDEEINKTNAYARDMFLKVGVQKSQSQVQSESTGIEKEKKEYKSYEELAKQFK